MSFFNSTHIIGPLAFSFHFVECGMGWSRWYYGLRFVWRGQESFRIRLWENTNHWSYKLGKSKKH